MGEKWRRRVWNSQRREEKAKQKRRPPWNTRRPGDSAHTLGIPPPLLSLQPWPFHQRQGQSCNFILAKHFSPNTSIFLRFHWRKYPHPVKWNHLSTSFCSDQPTTENSDSISSLSQKHRPVTDQNLAAISGSEIQVSLFSSHGRDRERSITVRFPWRSKVQNGRWRGGGRVHSSIPRFVRRLSYARWFLILIASPGILLIVKSHLSLCYVYSFLWDLSSSLLIYFLGTQLTYPGLVDIWCFN